MKLNHHHHESSLDIIELVETDPVKPTTQIIKPISNLIITPLNQDEERNVSNTSTLSSIM